jgi:DUF4097 and DUF4098 domain-containing protein YvlB
MHPTTYGGFAMPVFDTPEPVTVDIDVAVGDCRIIAGDRADTAVDVRPSDPGSDADRRVAEQTRVEFAAGRLLVKAPRQRGLFSRTGSIDVTIEVPTGSHLRAGTAVVGFHGEGELGECRVRTATGDLEFDVIATGELNTSAGRVTVRRIAGDAEVSTGTGRVRIDEVDGNAVLKNSNGDSWIGHAGGNLRISAGNGDVVVDSAAADVVASTAHGDVRVGEVTRGAASLKTAFGAVELGIRAGTAAQLDVSTKFGRVVNRLTPSDGPAASDETVDVRAHTSHGDILIRRS